MYNVKMLPEDCAKMESLWYSYQGLKELFNILSSKDNCSLDFLEKKSKELTELYSEIEKNKKYFSLKYLPEELKQNNSNYNYNFNFIKETIEYTIKEAE